MAAALNDRAAREWAGDVDLIGFVVPVIAYITRLDAEAEGLLAMRLAARHDGVEARPSSSNGPGGA